MPTSPARLEANAANAQHSTGPRTPEGQARSSQNARTHGLTARDVLIAPDERDEFMQSSASGLWPNRRLDKKSQRQYDVRRLSFRARSRITERPRNDEYPENSWGPDLSIRVGGMDATPGATSIHQ